MYHHGTFVQLNSTQLRWNEQHNGHNGKCKEAIVPRRSRRSRSSLHMETTFRPPFCIWSNQLSGSFEVNSHSLGVWEEALHMLPQLFSRLRLRLRRRSFCIPRARVRMGPSRSEEVRDFGYSLLDVTYVDVETRILILVSWLVGQ